MKKIVIINDVSNVYNPIGGPSICMKLVQNEIKRQMKNENLITITNDYTDISNSVIWHWSPIYNIDILDKLLNNNNNILICGPNSFFKGGDLTNYEKYLIENKKYSYLFLHPKQYSTSPYLKQYMKDVKIYDIIYPVSPHCYKSFPCITRIYDILFYKKFGCDDTYKSISSALSNYTSNTLTYGSYKIEELIELSSCSKCCIYLSYGETGGSACAEILCNGCPIISYYGNLTYGDDEINCIKLPDNGTFLYEINLVEKYVQKCFNMNNALIAENAREKFNLEKITSQIISILKDIANENVINN
jgi:hypothetical protein